MNWLYVLQAKRSLSVVSVSIVMRFCEDGSMIKCKNKRSGFINPAFYIVVIVVLLVLFNIPIIFLLLLNGFSTTEKIEVSCFEVIGLSVAIWASMNIVNFFDRKEFENKLEDSNREMKRVTNASKQELDKYKVEQKRIIEELNTETRNIKYGIRDQFLQELLKTIHDVVSEKTYYTHREIGFVEDIPYSSLLSIERLFDHIYHIYYNGTDSVDDKCATFVAQNAFIYFKECREHPIKDDAVRKHIDCYLCFREAQFLYYSSFKNKTPSVVKDNMLKSAPLFIRAMNIVGVNISDPSLQYDDIVFESVFDRKLCAYSLNMVGAVYIWMHRFEPKEYVERAERYCSNSVVCAGKEYQTELYYRNCGVAKEHIGKLDEAIKLYKLAFETTDISLLTMHCLLSIVDKQIDKIINLSFANKKREPAFGSKTHIKSIKAPNWVLFDDLQEQLKQYSELTIHIFPLGIEGYLYKAIYYRNRCLKSVIDGDSAKEEYIKKALYFLELASSINPSHKHLSVVKSDISDLNSSNNV